MQTIKILDPQEAIKIAAGEVIERPGHILKELIENSIDAGAARITIHSKQSGKKEILITDDGSGMSSQDAKLCFAHHATSKISSVHDLDSVATYGFRGEALSSITSVATVEITTKTADSTVATQIKLENGSIASEDSTAHPTGTTIKVSNLFDAIPARKKFLKTNETEWNLLVSIFQAFCLRYPQIHFKLFHDGKLSYNCPATSQIVQRSAQLWSNNLHDQLIEIEPTTTKGISISGAMSKSTYHRYNRNQIFTFVNNRWVKNIDISRAIIKGYQNVLPPQKYPAAFLFIEIDPKEIDINIHPKKEEVKFLHPGIMQKVVQESISTTLNKVINTALQEPLLNKTNQLPLVDQSTFSDPFTEPSTPMQADSKAPAQDSTVANQPGHQEPTIFNPAPTPFKNIFKQPSASQMTEPEVNQQIYNEEQFSIIGQFKTTYILIEKNQELFFVDQHAAHERILYEEFKKNFKQAATVQLLFPHILKLSEQDLATIIKQTDLFKKHGIIFEQFNETQLIIQATPVSMQHKAVDDIIQMTLSWIKENNFVDEQEFFKQLNEQLHAQKACKTACKAGDTLNQTQMSNIVKTLLTIENRFCCPHGRPTMWNLTLKEIEKHFKRDYKSPGNSLEL